MHEVGLAEPDAAVDEQRIVARARIVGDGERRRVREAVAAPDDELVENVAGVELGILGDDDGIVLDHRARRARLGRGNAGRIRGRDELDRHGFAERLSRRELDLVPVVLHEPIDEEGVRTLDHEMPVLAAHEPRRLEPGLEALRVHLGADALENGIPEVFEPVFHRRI